MRALLCSAACAVALAANGYGQHLSRDTGKNAEFPGQANSSKVLSSITNLKSSTGVNFSLAEYEVPTANSVPHILAIDHEDHIWFSESGGRFARNFIDVPAMNRIGRLDQSGQVSEWELSTEGSSPMGIEFDRNGDLWIAERLANGITRLRKNGKSDHYAIPTPGAWPTGLVIAKDGKVWFTETKGDKLGVVDPADGTMKEYPLPATKTMSTGIAADHDGNIWVAERDVNVIGKFDPKKEAFTQYPLPTKDARPCNVAVDPASGTLWFSERGGGKLGTIGRDGQITEVPLPDRFTGPFIMAFDKRGDIWFSNIFSNQIGRLTPATSQFEFFTLPRENTHPAGVSVDSKGNIWFAEQSTNRLGVIVRTDLAYITGEARGANKPGTAAQARFSIKEYDIPTNQSIPGIVGTDRNNVVWFTEMGGGFVGPGFPPGEPGNSIGYIEKGELHEVPMLTKNAGPTSMAKDPCSADIWVSLRNANKIARVRDKQVTEYQIPIENSLVVGIAVDYDHNVWVAMSDAAKLGRLSPNGKWKFVDLPDPESQPRTVHITKDNEVYFAEKVGNHVGHVNKKAWTVERYELPTRLGWPLSLEEDDKGNIWFAEMRADKLAMLDRKSGHITEYALPSQSAPFKVLFDKENQSFWISTVFASSIMRFDLSAKKVVANYRAPNEGAWVGGLDFDADKCIWFSEQFANKIGRLCIDGVSKPNADVSMSAMKLK